MKIRQATHSDVPRVIELWKEMMDLHRALDPVFTRREDGHVAFGAFLRDNIESDEAAVFVAEDGGQVMGYIMSRIQQSPPVLVRERSVDIFDISVDATCRRQGAGRQLVEAIREWARSQGVDRIELRAATANAISVPFWREMGFREYLLVMAREV